MTPLMIATSIIIVAIPTIHRASMRGMPYSSKWKRYRKSPPREARSCKGWAVVPSSTTLCPPNLLRRSPCSNQRTWVVGLRGPGRVMDHSDASGAMACMVSMARCGASAWATDACWAGCIQKLISSRKKLNAPVTKTAYSSQPSNRPDQVCSQELAWRNPSPFMPPPT